MKDDKQINETLGKIGVLAGVGEDWYEIGEAEYDDVELMTNAEKIRQFDDKQLARFLWIWKINSISTFLANGGMGSMNGKDMYEWLDQTTDTFVCTETFVGDDYIFDQDFRDKQADTPQTDCEDCDKYDTCPNADKGIPQTDCGWK